MLADGQNKSDMVDVILLTWDKQLSCLPPERRYQFDQRQQVLYPEPRAATTHNEVGVCGSRIGPADGHGKRGSIRELNRYPVFAPKRLENDEPERLPAPRMKGVDNPNLLWIGRITCS